jgi:exodeoxyribonuclease V alpha subunit
MSAEIREEKDWELDGLASAISSFFERKVKGEQGTALARLSRELAVKAGAGISHLEPEQADAIFADWTSLPAVGSEDENLPMVRTEDGKLYFRRFFEYERQVADAFAKRLIRPTVRATPDTIDFFKTSLACQVDDQQALAVGVSIHRDLLLLTGGPGTGKTRTIVAMLAAHLQVNPDMRIALAAPTGKAAFRMRESVLETMDSLNLPDSICTSIVNSALSTTLHRLLGSRMGSVDFRRNKINPLPYDLVVVDEASMVDLPLMAKLCDALRDETKLILVGDADQLAPVQGGAVFNGLVKPSTHNVFSASDLTMLRDFSNSGSESSGEDPLAGSLVSLSLVHRWKGSPSAAALGGLCNAIRDGNAAAALELIRDDRDSIRLVEKLDDPSIDSIIRRGFGRLAEVRSPSDALAYVGDFRILCAHNEGRYGVSNWNSRSDGLLPSDELRPLPIVVGVNDYTIGLFNGDDGVVLGNRAHFGAEEGTREVSRSRLPQYKQGYASSIHRSQGSEFDEVMIILPPADGRLLTKELLYVAVSRAKRTVTLVGDGNALMAAVEQSEESRSGVIDMLNMPLP